MSDWETAKEENTSKFTSVKEGESLVLANVKIRKNESPKFPPTKKDGEAQSYCWEMVGDGGEGSVVSVGAFALQKEMFNSGISDGDTINISHPGRGEYKITKTDVPF